MQASRSDHRPRRNLTGLATVLALGVIQMSVAATPPTERPLPNDPMDPIADATGANTGPLSGALVVTRDLAGLRRAFVDAAGLTMTGPLKLDAATADAQRALWQMPAGMHWQTYLLTRPSLPDSIRVLVIVPDVDTPVMRHSYAREETGPYALGFAMPDVRSTDKRFIDLGFKRTLPAVNEYPLQLRDGTPYPVTEASYEIVDNTRLVLMQRGGGLRPIGAIDPKTGLGGPSYSSLIVEDVPAMEKFFTAALDLERRSNREWSVFKPRFPLHDAARTRRTHWQSRSR